MWRPFLTVLPAQIVREPKRPRDVARLLAALVEGEGLGIGDRLPPEVELARRLGIGRSTVREALRQWESLGIITRNKGGGTRIVAEVSTRSLHLPLTVQIEADSLSRMLAVRRPLEIEAVRIATRVADEGARRRIMLRMLELIEVYESGEDWRPADHLFHAAIHDATGNPLFAKVIQQIHRAFNDLYEAPFDQPQLGASTIPAHRGLAEAIVAGDEEKAVAIISGILSDVDEAAIQIARGLHAG
ncbi:MAG: FadR family transcriptional regulator [Rhodobacterales bacterium]|nr:FadR family transcriptional regulator [Rhodobacterales bacterium]